VALDVIGVFLYFDTSPSTLLVSNVNILYGNLKSENFQDCGQNPQQNCMFMNSASGDIRKVYCVWSARELGGQGGGGGGWGRGASVNNSVTQKF
jgi:hypothetical protein